MGLGAGWGRYGRGCEGQWDRGCFLNQIEYKHTFLFARTCVFEVLGAMCGEVGYNTSHQNLILMLTAGHNH